MIPTNEEIAQQVSQARTQQSEAWKLLFKRYQLPLLAYCGEILPQRQEAMDVVQRAFIKAIQHLPSLRDDRKFASWLFGIARQESIDCLRRKGREQHAFDALKPSEEPATTTCPGGSLEDQEDAQLIISLIRTLESELREPITLYYLEDFSVGQIANIMDVPTGTIKSRLHRARGILKSKMEALHEPA